MKTLEPLIDILKQVKDELEKAIKPGPTLDYSQINKKPDRAAQEAAAPTIDYSNRMAGPKVTSAVDRANAVRAKLDAESKETALETIKRRQAMNKNMNASYQGEANQAGAAAVDDMAMSEKEPHKDDPDHEKKEQVKAKAIKEKAEEILDMHKGCDMIKASHNGQWYLEKASKESHSVFTMEHAHQVASMPHAEGQKHLHSIVDASSATPENKSKIKAAINGAKSPRHLSGLVANHVLAAGGGGSKPGELKVLKADDMDKAEGKETKHDRCARKVAEKSPGVDNPHAVCVSAGVEPEKWKK